MATLTFETVESTISLESQLDRLALEANLIANVIGIFKNIIPSVTQKLSGLLSVNTSQYNSDSVKACIKEYAELERKLKYANFTDYDRTLVSVPEGFKGNLLDYIVLINRLSPSVYSTATEILSEYSTMLSDFITNKDTKIALKDESMFFKQINSKREHMLAEMNHYFPTSGSMPKNYLGQTIDRFTDMGTLVQEVKTLDKVYLTQNINHVNESVKECVNLLNIIVEQTSQNYIENVSGPAANNIAKGAYEVARYIEFLSIFRYRTLQTIASVEKLIAQFNQVLK